MARQRPPPMPPMRSRASLHRAAARLIPRALALARRSVAPPPTRRQQRLRQRDLHSRWRYADLWQRLQPVSEGRVGLGLHPNLHHQPAQRNRQNAGRHVLRQELQRHDGTISFGGSEGATVGAFGGSSGGSGNHLVSGSITAGAGAVNSGSIVVTPTPFSPRPVRVSA
jgi:hypothetical protein